MSENEKFEMSSEWSAKAQINNDKYNKWYDNSLNNNKGFGVNTVKELIGLNHIKSRRFLQ